MKSSRVMFLFHWLLVCHGFSLKYKSINMGFFAIGIGKENIALTIWNVIVSCRFDLILEKPNWDWTVYCIYIWILNKTFVLSVFRVLFFKLLEQLVGGFFSFFEYLNINTYLYIATCFSFFSWILITCTFSIWISINVGKCECLCRCLCVYLCQINKSFSVRSLFPKKNQFECGFEAKIRV